MRFLPLLGLDAAFTGPTLAQDSLANASARRRRLGGRLRTDDQKGPIRTATYESLAAFLRESNHCRSATSSTTSLEP